MLRRRRYVILPPCLFHIFISYFYPYTETRSSERVSTIAYSYHVYVIDFPQLRRESGEQIGKYGEASPKGLFICHNYVKLQWFILQ